MNLLEMSQKFLKLAESNSELTTWLDSIKNLAPTLSQEIKTYLLQGQLGNIPTEWLTWLSKQNTNNPAGQKTISDIKSFLSILSQSNVLTNVVGYKVDTKGVSQIQKALKEKGFQLGASGPTRDGIDGIWGPISRKALLSFQQQNGCPINGALNSKTLELLNI